VDSGSVYSRTLNSWQLTAVYSGKMLHFLTRALLLTLASAGMGFAWLCCWLDRFRCGNSAGSWMIPGRMATMQDTERRCPETHSPRIAARYQPRTIDGMIRSRSAGA